MIGIEILFWLAAACLVHTYLGYPLLLLIAATARRLRLRWRPARRRRARRARALLNLPPVAVLVAAHNEERHVAGRIRNLMNQDYPSELLTVYVGSDASDDRTVKIVRALAGPMVRLVEFRARRGKASVIKDLVAMTTQEILVFTDANTRFGRKTLRKLVRHFKDPKVGCVCGELRLVKAGAAGENVDHVYWRYERMLKDYEGRRGALLGANGAVFALRREDYRPIPPNTIVDDFWLSMNVVEAGRRCVYDPKAIAWERIPERIEDEYRRRVRIGTGNYQALARFVGLLNPLRGWPAFAFLSHKVLRWLAPHCMLLALAANLALADQPMYVALLTGQLAFYAIALVGWAWSRRGTVPALLRLPLFFVSMNTALFVGFWHYLRGNVTGAWNRSRR